MIYHLAYTNISARTRSGRSKKRSSWCAVGEGNNISLSCEHTRNGLWVCACVLRALMLAESQDSACSHELDCTSPTAPCLGPWFKTPNAFILQPVMMHCPPPAHGRKGGRLWRVQTRVHHGWRASLTTRRSGARGKRYRAPRGGISACKVGAVGAHQQGGGASRPWLRRRREP